MEAQLARHGAVLTPVLVDDAGCFSVGDAAVAIDDVRPTVAKLDYDLFLSTAMPAFAAAVRKSPTLTWASHRFNRHRSPILHRVD